MVAYARAANLYRTVHVESAQPAQMLDELYGRLLEDCRRAADAIIAGDAATKGKLIDHALRIVAELAAALDHERAPDLCRKLVGLYGFVGNRLTRANATMDVGLLKEAERVILTLRGAFREAALNR